MAEAWLNGRFLPFAEAALPLSDFGFINGAVVTDNCRTWNRKLYRWPEHQARFRRDCQDCFIALPYDDAQLTETTARLLGKTDFHVITFATPGFVGMFTRPIQTERNKRFLNDGVKLRVVGHQPVLADSVLSPRVKHRSRMVWHIASQLANEDEVAILTDKPGGTMTETGIGNVLAVKDGMLFTPPRQLLLDGISLRATLELAEKLDIRWQERELPVNEIRHYDEWLLTGTGFGLAAVTRIDVWEFQIGPIASKLRDAFIAEVG